MSSIIIRTTLLAFVHVENALKKLGGFEHFYHFGYFWDPLGLEF